MNNLMFNPFAIFLFLFDPNTSLKLRLISLAIVISIIAIIAFILKRSSEGFIGTNMWYGYNFQDANKTSKEDRTKSLIKISKGWLPGERPKDAEVILENFENVEDPYNPRNYEIEPDYHRTIQKFGVDPNPVESLETPEFMIPKTYRQQDKYERIAEANDNSINAIKIRTMENVFKNVEKNKYYTNLLKSKCRAGNRSSYRNCGCNSGSGEY